MERPLQCLTLASSLIPLQTCRAQRSAIVIGKSDKLKYWQRRTARERRLSMAVAGARLTVRDPARDRTLCCCCCLCCRTKHYSIKTSLKSTPQTSSHVYHFTRHSPDSERQPQPVHVFINTK